MLKHKNFEKCATYYVNYHNRNDVMFLVKYLLNEGWNDETLIAIMKGRYSNYQIKFLTYKRLLGKDWVEKLFVIGNDFRAILSQQEACLIQLRGHFNE